jgi:D-alanyl-D-alanine carboxypeptidase
MKKRLNILIASMVCCLSVGFLSPIKANAATTNQQPKIVGTKAMTMDLSTGEIIYGTKIDEKAYPASITKLVTALLFADNKQKTDIIPYTQDAKKQPQYSLSIDVFKNLKVGDTMSAEDVMKALLLFSANDSAYMIADSVGGTSDNFLNMMNEKAKSIGMNNSHFVTANGLDKDDKNQTLDHYTTAYDLSILGMAAYKNPWIKEVMALTDSQKISTSQGTIAYVANRNKNIGVNGCIGGKTGYTALSGRCLVALYERDNRPMVGVVLNSAYDANDSQVFKDMETIIDWSYAQKRTPIYNSNSTIKSVTLNYKPLRFGMEKTIDMPLVVKEDVGYYENEINKAETKQDVSVNTNDITPWKLSTDKPIGTLTVTERNYSKTYDLYPGISKSDLINANKGLYTATAVVAILLVAAIIAVFALLKKLFKKNNRRY